MNLFSKFSFSIALALVSAPTHAGLWSMSNVVIARGGSATTTVTFTGDGVTTDTQLDILLPSRLGYYSFTAVPLIHGAKCVVRRGTDGRWFVRVLSPTGYIFPETPLAFCDIEISLDVSAISTSSAWIFEAGYVECAGWHPPYIAACAIDLGYVTVTGGDGPASK